VCHGTLSEIAKMDVFSTGKRREIMSRIRSTGTKPEMALLQLVTDAVRSEIGGGEAMIPLARAMIGGMVVSTVLTLFLVPCVYMIVKRTPIQPATTV